MGGGTVWVKVTVYIPVGLSPRGRGNLLPPRMRDIHVGSIPAWAGEPLRLSWCSPRASVYPRVGGGTGVAVSLADCAPGLSPRGRGNRGCWDDDCYCCGSIPAWAGEPAGTTSIKELSPVYPRVGGGTFIDPLAVLYGLGLSPRGRGNRITEGRTLRLLRSIPAWAGEPGRCYDLCNNRRVYPRVGGGTTATT